MKKWFLLFGGLEGKEKYYAERYQRRITYPAREIKQIIGQMREIESQIPRNWNDWQKAKYIYETLGKNITYNLDSKEYGNEQSSNLTVILSRKGICAGYSLLFKEMMDRQAIPCDYIRGLAKDGRGGVGKHAWNILHIEGKHFPIDLTWDSGKLHKGYKDLSYFGNKEDFFKDHAQDVDEKQYSLSCLNSEFINSIDTTISQRTVEMEEQDKKNIMQKAIEETYKKFEEAQGDTKAKLQVKNAIIGFINDCRTTGFTRNNMARQGIIDNIIQEDMVDFIIQEYVNRNTLLFGNRHQRGGSSLLETSIKDTYNKYGKEHTKECIRKYILEGNVGMFTRDYGARQNMSSFEMQKIALDEMVQNVVEREVNSIKQTRYIKNDNIQTISKMYFSRDEIAMTQLPKEKEDNIVKRAMSWIKTRLKERHINREQNKQEKISETKTNEDKYER